MLSKINEKYAERMEFTTSFLLTAIYLENSSGKINHSPLRIKPIFYLSNEIATSVKTEAATLTLAMKLFIVQ
jgi:hypothetical protein